MFSLHFDIDFKKVRESIDKIGSVQPYDDILRDASYHLQSAAIVRTPKRTSIAGTARRNYVVKRLAPLVWIIYNKLSYVKVLEEGSKPHIILPKRASVLAWKSNKGNKFATRKIRTTSKITGERLKKPQTEYIIFAKRVEHPGTRPYEMMKNSMPPIRNFIVREFNKKIGEIFNETK